MSKKHGKSPVRLCQTWTRLHTCLWSVPQYGHGTMQSKPFNFMDFTTQLKNRKSATITHINGRPTINHTESTYSNCFFLYTSNKFFSKKSKSTHGAYLHRITQTTYPDCKVNKIQLTHCIKIGKPMKQNRTNTSKKKNWRCNFVTGKMLPQLPAFVFYTKD